MSQHLIAFTPAPPVIDLFTGIPNFVTEYQLSASDGSVRPLDFGVALTNQIVSDNEKRVTLEAIKGCICSKRLPPLLRFQRQLHFHARELDR